MTPTYPLQATASAGGIATAELPTQAVGVRWTIGMISVVSDSVLASAAAVYVNNQFVVGTTHGNMDTASGDPPIDITGKDRLIVQWTGCTPGATCNAVIFYSNDNQR